MEDLWDSLPLPALTTPPSAKKDAFVLPFSVAHWRWVWLVNLQASVNGTVLGSPFPLACLMLGVTLRWVGTLTPHPPPPPEAHAVDE